jgi:hypothetical protein
MGITRAGGHVLTDKGWVLADDAEEAPEAPSMSNTKDELLAAAEAAGVDADESNTKAEILEALNGAE